MLDRALRVFGDVRAGEGRDVLRQFASILLLIAYYILKTVREPLILVGGGAELKSYAAAAQAIVLLFYGPAYAGGGIDGAGPQLGAQRARTWRSS